VSALPVVPTTGELDVPALALAGVPADAAARNALIHGLTLRALYALAARLSLVSGPDGDPYLVALVARAEARLGLTTEPAVPPPANSLLTPAWLWEARRLSSNQTRHPSTSSLASRQTVLAFLDYSLRDQRVANDGQLLKSLRLATNLSAWLAPVIGEGAANGALQAWADALTAQYASELNVPAPDASGLYYACAATISRAGPNGQEVLLHFDRDVRDSLRGLAGSGGYLAYVSDAPGDMTLVLLDPADPAPRTLAQASTLTLLGWSAAGQLLYLESVDEAGDRLQRYDPATGQTETLFDHLLDPQMSVTPAWSTNRTELGLSLVTGTTGGPRYDTAPVIVRVVDPVALEQLAPTGYGAWPGPDGQHAAYLLPGPSAADQTTTTVRVVKRGPLGRVVAEANHPSGTSFMTFVGFVNWAPDGQSIIYAASAADSSYVTYRLALAGGPPAVLAEAPAGEGTRAAIPFGFSADGRYLALVNLTAGGVSAMTALAWPPGPARTYAPLDGLNGAVWSPTGHTLAVASLGGLYLTDPATGAARWLAFEWCPQIGW
jgi:hypothetical protein